MNRIINAVRWLTMVQVIARDHTPHTQMWWAWTTKGALEWSKAYKPRYTVAFGRRGNLLGGRQVG